MGIHESQPTFPSRPPGRDPRRQDPAHPGGHAAAPVHRDLGGRGGRPGLRAVVEPEAAELVPDVSRGARGDDPGGGPRDPGPRRAHPQRAAEGGRRSRLSGEVQDSRVDPVRAGSRTSAVARHHDGAGASAGRDVLIPAPGRALSRTASRISRSCDACPASGLQGGRTSRRGSGCARRNRS